jgi:hypothetical protein
VKEQSEAACSFSISSPAATMGTRGREALTVKEHEQFPISVQALAMSGAPATGFTGSVTISSTWGDVCVGGDGCASLPNKVTLAGGTGSAMIQLNRETIPPSSAILRAALAGNIGTSGELQITVSPPTFTADTNPIVAPLTGAASYGFSSTWIGGPSIVKSANGWQMFYLGNVKGSVGHVGIGAASSTDGVSFDQPSMPIFEADQSMAGNEIGVPSAFDDGTTTHVYFGHHANTAMLTIGGLMVAKNVGYQQLVEITAPSAGGPFGTTLSTLVDTTGAMPDCAFCNAVDTPLVIKDPNPELDGGGPSATLMFFSALQGLTGASAKPNAAIVRASGDEGSYDVDPAPILASTNIESVIYSPRVFVDGTIYKMYYAFSAIGADGSPIDPCLVPYHIGYATSDDGHFWVRAPENNKSSLDFATPWAPTSMATLIGAAMPADGVDPSKGVALYFSPFTRVAGVCLPNGIGRAGAQ